ncbi:MAG: 16S rRNA (guanine(527)-N(7))-methyltransferase RsmG [Alphaproteobacteria bacterium]|nr:16S rRNA (guanine(527)-N(7))-methyltransferase RsmG [Alphaproteobacteria bacterium]
MNLSSDYKARLEEYCTLLKKWNKKINLISKTTELDIWDRHIIDSAQLLQYLKQDTPIIDLGAGAGLPGMVLSICGIKLAYLIESDTRKCAFLRVASQISEQKIVILNKRIEEISNIELSTSAKVVSRALAPLIKLLELYNNLELAGGMMLLKGKNYQSEIEEASVFWNFEYNIHNSIISNQSVILELKNVSKKY